MHGILEIDKGFVNAVSTWHGLKQYVCVQRPVQLSEAESVMDYEIEKRQLKRMGNSGQSIDVQAWALVRPDHDFTLVDSVGERFQVLNNKHMLKIVSEWVLAAYPGLEIESVGTLFGGATAFVNIKLSEYCIKGDGSNNVSNLMYANPLGRGSYLSCVHSTRIVCNNTLRAATAQGAANNTLAKFRHTLSAGERIKDHLIDLTEVKLGLRSFVDQLEALSGIESNVATVDKFLNEFFPVPDTKGRGKTMAENARKAYMDIYEGGQSMTDKAVAYSSYGLLQAYTDYSDHVAISRNSDDAAVRWDGVTGIRAQSKEKVMAFLLDS